MGRDGLSELTGELMDRRAELFVASAFCTFSLMFHTLGWRWRCYFFFMGTLWERAQEGVPGLPVYLCESRPLL